MISDFKDKHSGETCVIIGNGPSLKLIPRPFLDLYPTFGSNKIYLYEGFTPTYYVTSDPFDAIDRDIVDKMDCIKFTRRKTGFKNTNEFVTTPEHIFSKHPDIIVYEGYSVTFISMQLAYYMGFTTVLLVGIDHRYIYGQENHFANGYGDAMNWDKISLAKGEKYIAEAMILAKYAFENDGRKIINLTQDSNMKVFQIDNINNWYISANNE